MTRAERRRVRNIIEAGDRIKCLSMAEFIEITEALRGLAVHTWVLHDETCTPTACRCAPHFVIERLTPETYIAGQREQAQWIKETTS